MPGDSTDRLLEFDRNHLWHPYSSISNSGRIHPVKSASGVTLHLNDGSKLIDGMASWWSAIHGYSHPELVSAISSQAKELSHVMFGGLTHQPAVELGQQLINITPPELDCVFFADSGSVSVEVAMKMALQYQIAQGKPKKLKFLAFKSGYHGDTFHAMSVCDPDNGMHQLFNGVLPEHHFLDSPPCRYDETWKDDMMEETQDFFRQSHSEICAVIIEPIVQGAGGMKFYHPTYLRRLHELCQEYDILLIADEIATGFGRTGTLFACEHASICPDIMTVGKALTGGMLTLAAVLTSRKVEETISSHGDGILMHGPTFMANPLACAAACRSISLLLESDWKKNIAKIQEQNLKELQPCLDTKSVRTVRALGGIAVVELRNSIDVNWAHKAFSDRGVWVRPFGNLIYTMPAYSIKPEELSKINQAIFEVTSLIK